MAILVVLLAVLLVAALAWGFTRHQAATTVSARAAALDERVAALTKDVEAAATRATAAEGAAKTANAKADEQSRRADTAEAKAKASDEQRTAAEQRATAAEAACAEAITRAEAAEAAKVRAEADRDAAAGGSGPFQPDALWRLEIARVERLWRDRLALLPTDESPFGGEGSDVAAALKVLADASREESGIVIDLDWRIEQPLAADRSLQVLRLGEELIASVRDAEGGELVISEDDRTIELSLRTVPAVVLSDAVAGVLTRFGAEQVVDGDRVVLRVKAPGAAAGELFPDAAFAGRPDGDAPTDGATTPDLDLTVVDVDVDGRVAALAEDVSADA